MHNIILIRTSICLYPSSIDPDISFLIYLSLTRGTIFPAALANALISFYSLLLSKNNLKALVSSNRHLISACQHWVRQAICFFDISPILHRQSYPGALRKPTSISQLLTGLIRFRHSSSCPTPSIMTTSTDFLKVLCIPASQLITGAQAQSPFDMFTS